MIVNCGHSAVPNGISTGYGRDIYGYTFCYDCCHEEDKQWIRDNDKIVYYRKENTIVNWPGRTLGRINSMWNGNNNRTYIRVRMFDGSEWYGSGPTHTGDYVTLHRSKAGA